MTTSDLSPELRALVDARLDAIDHALRQAQMPYFERSHIVGEVEAQIFDLLGRREGAPGREDVLQVLADLDPPEAYIPEEFKRPAAPEQPGQAVAALAEASDERPRWYKPTAAKASLILLGFGLGLVADIALQIISAAGRELFRNENHREVAVGVAIVLTALLAAAAMVRLRRSKWLPIASAYARIALVFPLLAVDYVVAVLSMHLGNPLLIIPVGIAALLLNVIAVRWFWQSIPRAH